MFIYHILWTLIGILCVPLLPFQKARRLRARLSPRLGNRPPRPGCLWVHALSVGEVLSAVPLVKALARSFPDRDLVMTVTTIQGRSIADRELHGDVARILPMPLDFWPASHRLVRFLMPAAFILVETDLWPGLTRLMRRRKIPVVVVNGRISPRTARRYEAARVVSRFLLAGPTRWFMQSELDAERLTQAGVPAHRVEVTGNIKFDSVRQPMGSTEREGLLGALGLERGRPVWVAGSTHPGEEDVVLDAFERLVRRFPTLCLLLAPRRVERADQVARAAESRGFRTALRSTGGMLRPDTPVMILDTLGELGRFYGLGTVAFVGGSLVPVGGHNLLEPARFGLPVLFGPHMHNFSDMSRMLLDAGGGRQVDGVDSLERAMVDLLESTEKAAHMGRCAHAFVQANSGALARVVTGIREMLGHGG